MDFRILKGFNVNNRGCNPWYLYKTIRTPNGVQYHTFIYWTPFGVRIHVLPFPRVSPAVIHIQVLRTCKIVRFKRILLRTHVRLMSDFIKKWLISLCYGSISRFFYCGVLFFHHGVFIICRQFFETIVVLLLFHRGVLSLHCGVLLLRLVFFKMCGHFLERIAVFFLLHRSVL